MPLLHTVIIARHDSIHTGTGQAVTLYECEFAGIRFSRENEEEVKKWVRVAGIRVHGKNTQIIFLREERS